MTHYVFRNNVTGSVEFMDFTKMRSHTVMSELQALMDFFSFVQAQQKGREAILMTYSSYTTLPVLLQLVDRHGMDNILYKSFSAFCDIPALVSEVHPTQD